MARTTPIKVLVVDDSALVRKMLSEMLSSDRGIEVVGVASDPLVARQKVKALNPDVMTLDIEMPRMDGLAFLEKVMTLRPMPVVMVSSLTEQGAEATLKALELGAFDFVSKPKLDLQRGLAAATEGLVAKVKAAARAQVRAIQPAARANGTKVAINGARLKKGSEKLVAIGASTGGVEALKDILMRLPPLSPAVLIVQHMPEHFTTTFAARLDRDCAIRVCEARDAQRILPGHAYLAPGSSHLQLRRSGADYVCKLTQDPLVSGHRPSADVLFRSVAKEAGGNAVGVILTGMGRDGADGLLDMKAAGAPTVGQNEASCVVYGMPKAAFDIGAVDEEVSLPRIAQKIVDLAMRESAVRV